MWRGQGSGTRFTMSTATQCQENNSKEKCGVQYVNKGEEEEMEVEGFVSCPSRTTAVWVGIVLTIGLMRLVFHWKPYWRLLLTHRRCPLDQAETLLFKENYQGKFTTYYIKAAKILSTSSSPSQDDRERMRTVSIHLNNGTVKDVEKLRAVCVKKLWYVWDEESQSFLGLCGLDKGVSHANLHQYMGFTEQEQKLRQTVYGPNEISVPMQTCLTLLLLEILTPFYIFQVFTLIVWICEYYIYYTGAIIIMSVFGVTSSIIQTRRNQRSLHATVHSTDAVQLWRGGTSVEVPATSLVPGDVIIIPIRGCQLHCDAALLNGTCIVNESMLTGESVPVTKTPVPLASTVLYNAKEDTNHTLFCGTKVIQTRGGSEPVRAVVLRTGYLTAKGALVRSILYPPPADFRFEQDVNRFLGVLGIIAALGVIYTIVSKVSRHLPAGDVALKALDIITIVVPPALPATMTMGKLYAQIRLQAAKIFCINSRVINVAGSLDCVCFDKTGTLTEDGLDMWGVVPVEGAQFKPPLRDGVEMSDRQSFLATGMATCHSIARIDTELVGDPLDLKMFMFTGWELEEMNLENGTKYNNMAPMVVRSKGTEIGIVHQYQFSSTLQRMSVISQVFGSQQFVAFCKGSPEMIASLSLPDTVPKDLPNVLSRYTSRGYRVIALGWKTLDNTISEPIAHLTRDSVECDLNFSGLIVLENRLKPQSAPIIHQLRDAYIRTIMVTGDNVQTAVSVARDCGIVDPSQSIVDVTAIPGFESETSNITFTTCSPPLVGIPMILNTNNGIANPAFHSDEDQKDIESGKTSAPYVFALTGSSWATIRENFPELLSRILTRGAVFARMSSDQKQQLVTALKDLGYCVAMCGDGANDCGALKAAHAGISLSEAEASVASPFTSREANISCVPRVVREGRAALVTAFGVFKFMVAYSISEFVSVAILYSIDSNLTDFQFLFIDICLVVNFALFFGKTHAYGGPLVKEIPTTSLFSLVPMSSLVLQVFFIILIQVLSFLFVQTFSWFIPFKFNGSSYTCYENYAVFTVSMFQYISLVLVFSQGAPYRASIMTNRVLIASLAVMTAICMYITLDPADQLKKFLELMVPPSFNFRIIVLCLALVHLVLSLFIEKFIIQNIVFKKLRYACHSIENSSKEYLKIEHELLMNRGWPPLSGDPPRDTLNMVTKF